MAKVKLNEVANIYLGVTHTPEYVFEGVPFLSVKDISGGKICFDDCKYISKEEYDSLSEGAKPKVGDMLFCRVGTLGKPIIIPEGTPLFGSFVSLGYLRNRNSDRCDLNYLKYWMYSNSFWKQVNANVKGASQVNLNTGWLSKFDIDLPGIAEQRYRISVLDKCKSVIEKREAELAALDNLIKARFVEMFGDVQHEEKYKGIPLRDLCTTMSGGTPSTKFPEYYEGDIPWISTVSLGPNHINGSTAKGYITQEAIENSATKLIPAGNILFGTRVGVGKSSLNDVDICTNQDIVAIIGIDESRFKRLFIKYVLDAYQPYYDSIKKGATILGITGDDLKDTLIPDVPLSIQVEFELFVEQVDKSKVIKLKMKAKIYFLRN